MTLYERLSTLKMIVVEDDPLLRNAMLQFFQSKGCVVRAFSNAAEAMRAMEEERFDVVISNHYLPGLDGVTFLMRTSRLQPETVRILLTEYPNPCHRHPVRTPSHQH